MIVLFVSTLIGLSRKGDSGAVVEVADRYGMNIGPITTLRGGYGKLVQKELEAQRELVDYGAGSLGSFSPVVPSNYGTHGGNGRHGGNYNHGGSQRHRRGDYHRKRYREDDRRSPEISKRDFDHDRRRPDPDSRPEKNPRFRERGDSDSDADDDRRRRRS